MTKRWVTVEEAHGILSRFNSSHFRNPGAERARYSIPARPDHDDDLLLQKFIEQHQEMESELARLRTPDVDCAACDARATDDAKNEAELELLRDGLRTYGLQAQLDLLQEACAGLIAAISRERRGRIHECEIAEDLADVLLVALQVREAIGVTLVDDWADVKLERLRERIRSHRTRQALKAARVEDALSPRFTVEGVNIPKEEPRG